MRNRTKSGMHFDAESGKLPIPAMNERMGCKRLTLLDHELKNPRLMRALFDVLEICRGSKEGGTCREISNNEGLFSPIL